MQDTHIGGYSQRILSPTFRAEKVSRIVLRQKLIYFTSCSVVCTPSFKFQSHYFLITAFIYICLCV